MRGLIKEMEQFYLIWKSHLLFGITTRQFAEFDYVLKKDMLLRFSFIQVIQFLPENMIH